MMLENRELFYRDPLLHGIPNDGVAKVGMPETDAQWEVLRWELSSFVCDGQYERGLDQILTSFLGNLSRPTQPAAWVSGFYGSGKSHLVRVLEFLWRDIRFPDGTAARDLVNLPDEIKSQLVELSTVGRRAGGLWSAAGTLAAGRSEAVRLAFLSILFESAGLPGAYPQARFTMWARENGYTEAIEAALRKGGRIYEKEIHDLYVSPVFAAALLAADPTLADSEAGIRDLLRAQFPPTPQDISDEEMFDAMAAVLAMQSGAAGELPLTLLVLDEMQQYIGEDTDKALAVQNLVEGCSARFESRVLFVATGQSALTVGGTLQRLIDRFTVPVVLSDNDVETVVRKVVLMKKPEHMRTLEATIDSVAGEIDRQLGGTRYATRAEDKVVLAPDYPVLPNRWRLWSEMLRAIDKGGKSGLVRSQLALIHSGVRKVAELPLGHVIGADYLFFDEQAHIQMVMSGVLLREVDNAIGELIAAGGESAIKGRLCALIFLLSQMSESAPAGESGLRPTAGHLADLLVEDLASEGAELRRQMPELLDGLVTEGRLVKLDDEYRLLTQEDAEWGRDYNVRLATIRDDSTRIMLLRSGRLAATVERELEGIRLAQGKSREARNLAISFDADEPKVAPGNVPVWVRDEWSVAAGVVQRQAGEAGDEDPTVFVLLPKHENERLKELLASEAAAEETLVRRPTPQTPEGRAAYTGMRTRLDNYQRALDALLGELVARARVFQGGGVEMTVTALGPTVETAAERSLHRLFPKFDLADDPGWGKVVEKVRSGAPDALALVGHEAAPTTNPVCREVLSAVTGGGVQGSELRQRFGAPPYGWPKDAVNGAIAVLVAAGNLRAAVNGKDVAARDLLASQIGKATLYKEDEPPSVGDRLAVRGLLRSADVVYTEDQELAAVPGLLQRLRDLAERAGGEPPLPAKPAVDHLDELRRLGGNRLLKAVAESHERLAADLREWSAAAARRDRREVDWDRLLRLVRHARDLSLHADLEAKIAGIRDGRQLLQADPNPLDTPIAEVEEALRARLREVIGDLAQSRRDGLAGLEAIDDWLGLEPADREEILATTGLATDPDEADVLNSDLLETLDARSLSDWAEQVEMVRGRVERARILAARKLTPESVRVEAPRGTVHTEADLERMLESFRAAVEPHLRDGKTVII